MGGVQLIGIGVVHCRTGSLEKYEIEVKTDRQVHCRTGSLEKYEIEVKTDRQVHCRTGSLENTR